MSRRKRNNNGRFSLFAFQDIITCIMGIMLLLTLIMCLQITTATAMVDATTASQIVEQMKRQATELSAEVSRLETEVGQQLNQLNAGAISDGSLLTRKLEQLNSENQRAQQRVRQLWEQKADTDARLNRLRDTARQNQNRPQQTTRLQQQNEQLQQKLEEMKQGNRVVYNAHDSSTAECWLVELKDESNFQAARVGRRESPQAFASQTSLQSWMAEQHRRKAAFLLLVRPAAADILDTLTQELRQQKMVFGFDLLPAGKVAIDPQTGAVAE